MCLFFQEVTFPSITVCNLNRVEASFLKERGIYGNSKATKTIMNEFMFGRNGNLSQDQKKIINSMKMDKPFQELSRQKCRNLFLSMKYQGQSLSWNDLPLVDTEYDLGPALDVTDYGACCYFSPFFGFEKMDRSKKDWKMAFHETSRWKGKAKNGESNGLDILLHAEQFNYAFYKVHGAGFKISLMDHRDKAMMQFSSNMIQMGSETQINVKPSIVYTTQSAIETFSPDERDCYADGEVNMNYLDYYRGFRYQINNCLIDEGIREIIWNCRCLPQFFEGYDDPTAAFLQVCTGDLFLLCHDAYSVDRQ